MFVRDGPANADGQLPFLANLPGSSTNEDFTTPYPLYFDHADYVINKAAEHGIYVLLTPTYLGFAQGNEGWYREIVANGPTRMRQYGEYLGQRYKDFNNLRQRRTFRA